MTTLFTSKTNFTAGEIAHDLLGRVDLRAYENGAMALKNVLIEPTGGVYRRPGLRYICEIGQPARLIQFDLGYQAGYLIVLKNTSMDIYLNDNLVQTVSTPWTAEQISAVCWCQDANRLFLVHPDVQPRVLAKNGETFELTTFSFVTENECILQPYHKFCADQITLSSTGLGGTVTLTTSADYFTAAHVGMILKIADGYAVISAVTDAKNATAEVKKQLIDEGEDATALEPTRYWFEPAFSDEKGWPATVAFYQSRLVFGGSKKLPNNLWFSVSGDLFNFELGAAYDADAIDFELLSDGANKICGLFSGRHLQVFTTNSEWMVSGEPLTPSSIQLKRQTLIGSIANRYVPPLGVDGATIFASGNGREIREFLFGDLEGVYLATDLSLLSAHLIQNPIDMAYDPAKRSAYIVMENGHLVTLTTFRTEDVQSFSEQITQGEFCAVCVAGDKPYFIIKRANHYFLETFDETMQTDCAVTITRETPQTQWSYLPVLSAQSVKIVGDGITLIDGVVDENGLVVSEMPVNQIQIGLGYTHLVVPLPPAANASNAMAPVSQVRFIKGVFRLVESSSLQIDTGNGVHQELNWPLNGCVQNADGTVTGDVVVRGLGWNRRPTCPLWQITGDLPKFFKLVSVTQDLKIGG